MRETNVSTVQNQDIREFCVKFDRLWALWIILLRPRGLRFQLNCKVCRPFWFLRLPQATRKHLLQVLCKNRHFRLSATWVTKVKVIQCQVLGVTWLPKWITASTSALLTSRVKFVCYVHQVSSLVSRDCSSVKCQVLGVTWLSKCQVSSAKLTSLIRVLAV